MAKNLSQPPMPPWLREPDDCLDDLFGAIVTGEEVGMIAGGRKRERWGSAMGERLENADGAGVSYEDSNCALLLVALPLDPRASAAKESGELLEPG